ncbi:hypothetical protein C8J57DRAFT_1295844, partial [Mycena rebaudengoi]
MDAIQAAHDELFYATFPDARPNRRSARVEQEHAQIYGFGLLPVSCPPGELNGGGMVPVLSYAAPTYDYADPDVYGYGAAVAYMEPTMVSPYAAIAAGAAIAAHAYAHPPPPHQQPRRLITDVSSLAHAVTPSASPVEPPPLSAVSSVSTSSSSSKRRYSVFASESPPEEPTTRDPRRRRSEQSEHTPPSARSSRERSSESEPPPTTTNTNTARAQQESKACESPKKPPLACLFCRGRKIACGPPVGGSVESVGSCNQCQRRALKCEYPAESRRGMRKKKGVVVGPSTTLLAGVGGSSSTILAAASLGAGGSRVKHEHEHQFEVNGVFESTGDVKPGIKTESSVGSMGRIPTPPSASSSSSGMKVAIKTEADVGMPSLPSSSSSAPMASLQPSS